MEDTISNKCKRCKDCRWLKIGRHNAYFSRGEGTCTQPYRGHTWDVNGRSFSSMPCRYFEEREDNNMDIEKTIKNCECKFDKFSSIIDQIESQILEEPPIPEEDNIPINRYGLGEILHVPFKIVGIRSIKDENGKDIVLYDITTAIDQRIGFKIIENDNEHHMAVTIPEDYILDYLKVDELAELFGGEKSMIDNCEYSGFLVYSIDRSTYLHIGLGMFPTYYKAVSIAYADAATRHIPVCMEDNEDKVKMSSLYPLEGGEDFAFDVIDDKGKVDVTYYIVSCYNDKDRYHELGFKNLV